MLIGVIQKNSLAEIAALLRRMDVSLFDHIELRLDACADLSAEGLAALTLPLPAIFTLRRQEEGGHWPHGEEARLSMLASLMRLKPAYMDIESTVPPERVAAIRACSPQSSILISRHDFKQTPSSLLDMLAPMLRHGEDVIYKLAAHAHNSLDALRMLSFCKEQTRQDRRVIGISMGEYGVSTRILAPVVHAGFCYCPVEESSAPGQIDAATLRAVYNSPRLNANTAIYGLLGDPVEHSIGHIYHNARNAVTGCNAVYVKWKISREETANALALLLSLDVKGLSVTMPLKDAVLPCLSYMDDAVHAIGAANTLKADAGGWSATNTDGPGALDSLPLSMQGKSIVIIGAGGAAKAVMHEAAVRGAKLTVYNRSTNKVLPVPLSPRALCDLAALQDLEYDVIINALPFDSSVDFGTIPLRAGTLAMDLSYGTNSAFLEQARASGCALVDGSGMFIEQAKRQRAYWGLPE